RRCSAGPPRRSRAVEHDSPGMQTTSVSQPPPSSPTLQNEPSNTQTVLAPVVVIDLALEFPPADLALALAAGRHDRLAGPLLPFGAQPTRPAGGRRHEQETQAQELDARHPDRMPPNDMLTRVNSRQWPIPGSRARSTPGWRRS